MYFVDPAQAAHRRCRSQREQLGTTQLPAGVEEENNAVTCGVFVFDLLDAVSTVSAAAQVYTSTLTLEQKQAIVQGQLAGVAA